MSHVKTDKLSARTASGTITLGESGETLTVPSGVTLTNNGTNGGGFGKVLQVVSTTKTDTTSTTSTSWVDISGLSVTITPSSASNKILLSANVSAGISDGASSSFRFIQDGSEVLVGDQVGSNRNRASFNAHSLNVYHSSSVGMHGLITPNTTSAITYKIQWMAQSPYTSYVNRGGNYGDTSNNYNNTMISTITAMEIQG